MLKRNSSPKTNKLRLLGAFLRGAAAAVAAHVTAWLTIDTAEKLAHFLSHIIIVIAVELLRQGWPH